MTITAAMVIAKQNAHASCDPLVVRDLSNPDRPVRLMTFASGQASPSVIVQKVRAIELFEQDADVQGRTGLVVTIPRRRVNPLPCLIVHLIDR